MSRREPRRKIILTEFAITVYADGSIDWDRFDQFLWRHILKIGKYTSGDMIPLNECKDRAIYEIDSRNLIVGVFVKDRKGFIGIREKFGSRFLFTEYHYDTGAPYGTVRPLKELTMAPENLVLNEQLETLDQVTRRPVAFDRPVVDGGKGWYFIDTGEASEEIDPAYIENEKLFELLEKIEKTVITQCQKCKRRRTPSQLDQDGHCPTCRTKK